MWNSRIARANKRCLHRLLCAAVGLLTAFGLASVASASVLAKLDGQAVHQLTVDVMLQMAQQQDAGATKAAVLEEIISNRSLVRAAHKRFAGLDLQAGAKRVGFDPAVAADDQLAAALRSAYLQPLEAGLKVLPGASLQGKVSAEYPVTEQDWKKLLGADDKLIVEYRWNQAQLKTAQQIIVLRSSLAPGGVITLADVYQRQNVQGRVELFARNQAFVRQQAMLYLSQRYVQDWAEQRFGSAAVADLRQALQEQNQVRALLALHGIGADIDAESPVLNSLAKQVKAAEIQSYYRQHKEEFKRIAAIRARHIRVADQATAERIVQEARRGQDFAALARQWSIAPDAASGGDLGEIRHQGQLSWLQELAMMQEPGQVSPPFRAAVGPHEPAYWEVILVSQRQDGYQPADSESVRYLASRAIAQEKAVQQIRQLQRSARQAAKVEYLTPGSTT